MAERGRVECVDIATAVPQLADNFIDRTSRQSRANCCHELAVNDTLPPDSFRQEARAGGPTTDVGSLIGPPRRPAGRRIFDAESTILISV